MSNQDQNKIVLRPFASCKIEWDIVNFSLAVRPEICTIHSKEFLLQGINDFKWRMNLVVKRASDEDVRASVHLERIPMPPNLIPEIIFMEVTITAGEKTSAPIDICYDFEKISETVENMQNITDVWKNLLPFTLDILRLQCYLIVCKKEQHSELQKPCSPGLMDLSKDLQSLALSKMHTDITIKVDEKNIEAHKCILSRNTVFNDYIRTAEGAVIKLPNLDYQAVSEFINFLYSGNVDCIFYNPSVAMVKCIEHFNSDILKCYYTPEELKLFTTVRAESHEFNWVISNFLDIGNNTITSPPIRRLNVNTTWRLLVSMKRRAHETEESGNIDYVSIFAEIADGDRPPYFCLEFAIGNNERDIHFPKKILRVNRRYDAMGFEEFVSKNSLIEKSLLLDDTVRIIFHVRTSNGNKETSIGCRTMSFVTSTDESSYEELSSEMAKLFQEERYSDITIKAGNKAFKAHKCVLAARSQSLSRKIADMPSDIDTLDLENVEPKLLELIVDYIYTGVLKVTDTNVLGKLYGTAENLGTESLKEECKGLLGANSTEVSEATE